MLFCAARRPVRVGYCLKPYLLLSLKQRLFVRRRELSAANAGRLVRTTNLLAPWLASDARQRARGRDADDSCWVRVQSRFDRFFLSPAPEV